MADVLCLGEALIDLVPTTTGVGLAEAETFVKAAGGAPANVAVGLARLGVSSGFIGRVGDDPFGRFLIDTLSIEGVAVGGLRVTRAAPTALAVVSLGAGGDRDFIFYGRPAAHAMLTPTDIDQRAIREAAILHFGSISLIADPAREATLHAVELAHRHGVSVSFDPNLRLPLWPDAEAAREGMTLGLSQANLVKLSEDEVRFLQGDSCDLIEAARALWHPGLDLMAVTRGAQGSLWLDTAEEGEEPGFTAETVDTTGAGDAFTAALLAGLAPHRDQGALSRAELGYIVRFANAAGALATTKRGAIPALPDREDVERFLKAR